MINKFNFKRFKDKVLITNDLGRYMFLDDSDFNLLIKKDISLIREEVLEKLSDNYFIFNIPKELFVEKAGYELRNYKKYLFLGTTLHIFVLTNNCNQNCVYCQASVNKDKCGMMTIDIAKKAVDLAMNSPSKYLTFEFQGGEPLLNFEVLKYIIEYTNSINKDKCIQYVLVSNLLKLDDYKLHFLMENNVNISTSLDGPGFLHNLNRPFESGNAFEIIENKINSIQSYNYTISAIQTTTRKSLKYSKEIVDQYLKLHMNSIFIRPLTNLGYAKEHWSEIGYTYKEFLDFYRDILNYIIYHALNGVDISEGHARIFLRKILEHDSQNYMELRSPCGAGIGQLAYNYDGNIYTCDEARMLAEMGDRSFGIGNVYSSTYKDLMDNPICKTIATASCLENLSQCRDCIYNPYCGTCPIISYAMYGTPFINNKEDYRCNIYKGMLDIIFELLYEGDGDILKVLYSWAE